MDTRYLRTLCTVLESGSFSKTASELFISQSAVSQRIRFIEDFYGLPLVDRSGGAIQATEAGAVVNAKARQILAIEKELELELKNLDHRKRLTLCSTPTFGIVYLPKVLNRFFLANSGDVDLKFTLNTPEHILKSFIDNECDIAVIEHCGELTIQNENMITLPPDELLFISSPSLNLSAPSISIDELLTQRIVARRDGCSSRCLLQENLHSVGKSLNDFKGMIIYDDLHLTIQTVMAGRGVAFVSKNLVREQLDRKELSGHVVEGFQLFRSRTVLTNQKRKDEPLIKQFIQSVCNVFDED